MSDPALPDAAAVREWAFAEMEPALTSIEASVEANRCLFCHDPPCVRACPTSIDVPSFIHKIATDNLKGAARVVLAANPLGGTCARICPVEEMCEGACVLARERCPIQIGRLQRHATDWLFGSGMNTYRRGPRLVGRVAIVGGGPAGLAAAVWLAEAGLEVRIFEAEAKAGGLGTYGIVSYRLPAAISRAEVALVEQVGVEIRTGVQVGQDLGFDQLLRDNDLLLLAVGLGGTAPLGLPGDDLPGVRHGLQFLAETKTRPLTEIEIGERVLVIGAGNTAIDCATAALRLGAAEAEILYRRSAAEMPAYDFECDFARREGVYFRWLTQPKRILGATRVEGVECVRTRLGAPDDDGRRRPEEIPGSEFRLAADTVIVAIGQTPRRQLFEHAGVDCDAGGRVRIDPATGLTSQPQIYAAGDCVDGDAGTTVVQVVGQARQVAAAIIARLGDNPGTSAAAGAARR